MRCWQKWLSNEDAAYNASLMSNPMCRSKGKTCAFTLVELLVVVSILALLIGILVPSLKSARRVSKRVVCGSQLRAVGQALRMYLNDSNDYLPIVSDMPSFEQDSDNPRPSIGSVLAPYVNKAFESTPNSSGGDNELLGKGVEVFHCPSDRPGVTDRGEPNKGKSFFETELSSYAFNVRLQFYRDGEFYFPDAFKTPVKLSEVVRTSRAQRHFGGKVAEEQIWLMRDYIAFHGKAGKPGASNYLYVDGRVGDLER